MRKEFKRLVVISLIISLVLYFLGLFTGLRYGNEIGKIFESRSNELVVEIKRVSNELDELRILSLSNFLSEEDKCQLIESMFEKTKKVKEGYYKILPYRLEEYELEKDLPQQYLETKVSYQELQLKEWLLVMNLRTCNEKIIPILYFYKQQCGLCVRQGEEMDKIRDFLKEKGFIPMIYTVDLNFSSPILTFLKKRYNISDAPSFIFLNTTFSNFTDFETFKSYFEKTQYK